MAADLPDLLAAWPLAAPVPQASGLDLDRHLAFLKPSEPVHSGSLFCFVSQRHAIAMALMTMETKDPLHIPAGRGIAAELIAVLVAVIGEAPHIMTIRDAQALPSGPFESSHRSLQSGLREWVEQQTGHPIGYMEQLYTFADRDRGETDKRTISISYLGLTREESRADARDSEWRDWYDYFPWEDHRKGTPELFEAVVAPRLRQWADEATSKAARADRWQRAAITFGLDEFAWNEALRASL
jgi:hypothetical protein